MRKKVLLIILGTMIPVMLLGQAERRITDSDIPVGSQVTFHSDTTYILEGAVFVDSAAVLTIEPGTLVKAEIGDGNQATALVVTRYGKIFAQGTADRPIIFTSVDDDLTGSIELEANNPNQDRKRGRGRWGGIVVLGRASTNNATGDGLKEVEGINDIDAERALYGGNVDDDNSGIIRYVSIRYTGINVGDQAGNEIQGLTMGGVGSGTTVEFVESYRSNDDGFEFFGGTVNTRYLVSAFNSDDGFDWDEGFRGKHQFWFGIQDDDFAGRAAEMDGATGDEFFTPFATPYLSNVTYIGPGLNANPSGDGDVMLKFRDNTGGKYHNSVFTEYDVAGDPDNGFPGVGGGIEVEDIDNSGSKTEDSRKRLEAGELVVRNNIWWDFGIGNGLTEFAAQDFAQAHLAANNNTIADPQLLAVSRVRGSNGLDPRPGSGSPALSGAETVGDPYFVQTSYLGAFSEGNNWLLGWTALDNLGYLSPDTIAQPGERRITDSDIPVGSQVTFHSDTTYILEGAVFVDSAAVLTIEPGTLVKAEIGDGNQATALVVTRYGKIFAQGTADRPIIFTSVDDDLTGSIELEANNPNQDRKRGRGRWGGIVVLGRASTNNATGDGLKEVEGINDIDAERALYGGNVDDDNSGIIRYVSIRYTGINVGDQAGNEIQGLTMGGVGSGTTVEFVESYRSNDDGFEFFGGTVNTRYLVSAFNSDDGFDWDEGFRGKHQFWFGIQDDDFAGRAAEMDGATGDEFFTPFATPYLSNVTYIGPGLNANPSGDGDVMLKFRDNTGGKYHNSVFTEYDVAGDPDNGFPGVGGGIEVEDIDNSGSKTEDSRKRLEAGELVVRNNIWWDFGIGNGLTEFAAQDFAQAHLAANNNTIADPQLLAVSRVRGSNGLDPRPGSGSPALSGAETVGDPYFVQTSYLGAFSEGNNWLLGWTALYDLGYLGDNPTSVEEKLASPEVPNSFSLAQNHPNPFNPSTAINFNIAQQSNVRLSVYNMLGQKVATLVDGPRQVGQYTVTWDASSFGTGVYVYRLETGGQSFVKRMTLIK